jgi:hypothetical protein
MSARDDYPHRWPGDWPKVYDEIDNLRRAANRLVDACIEDDDDASIYLDALDAMSVLLGRPTDRVSLSLLPQGASGPGGDRPTAGQDTPNHNGADK